MKTRYYKVDGFDRRLKTAIANSNLSVTDVQRKSGVSRSNMWGYMFDGVSPSAYTVMRLAIALNVSADYLLGIEGRK